MNDQKMCFIYINQHESVWELELVCRNTWQPAGTSAQVRHSLTRGEANCKLSDLTDTKTRNFPHSTPLDCCLRNFTFLGYNVKPAAMETSKERRKEHPVLS